MRNDTEPTGGAHDTDPDDSAPAASTVPDTDPGSPPVMSAPARVPYRAEVEDSDVASLLGKLAPARVPPAVGDTRETDGHDAAAFRIAPHRPPRAHETPDAEAPVVIAPPTSNSAVAVESDAAARRAREVSTFARPRAPRFSVAARIAVGLALGTGLCVAGVVAGVDYMQSQPPAAAPPAASHQPFSPSTVAVQPPTAPSESAATPVVPSVAAVSSPPSTTARVATVPARAAAAATAPPPSSASPKPAAPPSSLPKDIRWSLE